MGAGAPCDARVRRAEDLLAPTCRDLANNHAMPRLERDAGAELAHKREGQALAGMQLAAGREVKEQYPVGAAPWGRGGGVANDPPI